MVLCFGHINEELTSRPGFLIGMRATLQIKRAGPLFTTLSLNLHQLWCSAVEPGRPPVLLWTEGGAGVLSVLTGAQHFAAHLELLSVLVGFTIDDARFCFFCCSKDTCREK